MMLRSILFFNLKIARLLEVFYFVIQKLHDFFCRGGQFFFFVVNGHGGGLFQLTIKLWVHVNLYIPCIYEFCRIHLGSHKNDLIHSFGIFSTLSCRFSLLPDLNVAERLYGESPTNTEQNGQFSLSLSPTSSLSIRSLIFVQR